MQKFAESAGERSLCRKTLCKIRDSKDFRKENVRNGY